MYITWKLLMGIVWFALFCAVVSLAAVVVTIIAAGFVVVGIIVGLGHIAGAISRSDAEAKGSIEP